MCIPLLVGHTLLCPEGGQKGAAFAFSLPECWHSFMALGQPAPGQSVGRPDLAEAWVASAVIPMGWAEAAPFVEHLHCRMGLEQAPRGAGHTAAGVGQG